MLLVIHPAAALALKAALLIAAILIIVYGIKYANRRSAVKSKVSIGAYAPTLSTKDGRYLYKVNLTGNTTNTKIAKVEVFLDKSGSYYKTSKVFAGSPSEDWTVSGNNDKIKSGIGSEADQVVLYFDMDGANIATSYAKTTLRVSVKFDFVTFFKTFKTASTFDYDVPGPYRDVEVPWADLNWRYGGTIITNDDLVDWEDDHVVVGND